MYARSLTLLSLLASASSSIVPQIPLSSTSSDTATNETGTPLPLLIWHGLGDQYNNPGIASVGELASEVNPGTFVYAIRLADDGSADKQATFLGDVNAQIDLVCADLAKHPVLSTAPAVNALGFSQGGQFLRAFVQRCNFPRVEALVTFGSQHNGIAEFQACGSGDWLCRGWQGVLKGQTWSSYVQHKLVPAQYYRDPEDLESYLEYSNFLADVNNERSAKNETYRRNLASLEKFVMFVFSEDQTVVPKWSGWFEEVNKTDGARTKLQDRQLYKEDWLGLKQLDQQGKLEFRETKGGHMALSDKILKDVFRKYFSKRVDVPDDDSTLR